MLTLWRVALLRNAWHLWQMPRMHVGVVCLEALQLGGTLLVAGLHTLRISKEPIWLLPWPRGGHGPVLLSI